MKPRGCLAFAAGAAFGYGLAILGYMAWSHFHPVDFEGEAAMTTALFYGPLLALIGGVAAVIADARRR